MLFDELNDSIPADSVDPIWTNEYLVKSGPGWAVRVRYPGKYAKNGKSVGDFVVEVSQDGLWDEWHKFKHADFFADVEAKAARDKVVTEELLCHIGSVCQGAFDPEHADWRAGTTHLPGILPAALVYAMQALSVCEYRRFPQGDVRGGGRYLPLNFMLAVAGGFWSADEATRLMRVGRPALESVDGLKLYKASTNFFKYQPWA
jgi:hypothetical protein